MRPEPNIVKAKKREIQVRYRNGKRWFAALRVAEITRLLESRYGATLPDDDAGAADARIMAHHLAQTSDEDGPRRIAIWLARWAQWMSPAAVEALITAATTKPIRWRAKTAGVAFRLVDAERTRLKITTIAAIDVTAAELAKRRKQRNRERMAAARRAKGMKPRKQYEAAAAGRGKPWITAGMSRASWYRKRNAKVMQ
jgi:hypothetical protein